MAALPDPVPTPPAPALDLERPWLSERLVAWPILASGELAPESALSLRVFGLPLLLVRGADGRASAHIDACPHRLVSFSCAGTPPRVQGSVVRCPYHYQEFDQDGRCVHTLHGETGSAEHLVTLPLREWAGFLWLPAGRRLFAAADPAAWQAAEVEAALQAARLPAEFERELLDPATDALPLFHYRYPVGPWGLVLTSGIDHTHGFHVHAIARTVHQLRRWLGQETLSGMHMVCDDDERSVLVTYEQYRNNLQAYWKVGGAPNLWLNKLDEGLHLAVLFVPDDQGSTTLRGTLYAAGRWRSLLENGPALKALRDLSNHNNEEDRPFIESQAALLGGGRIPVGNASINDAPVYRFFRYLEAITGTPIAFGAKPHPRDLLVQRG
ncbi:MULTISPECIES: Rieske 2Fe-2S domain-containing protein [unclassified Synechococcus]|uniref:Rieske 2Fe-2S domain-containing protein n=1 Tax=unclassified Synechococcus TaxID=2626047 RepID=UPI0021A510DB|nr:MULTISPECIES: Rieske 2Fe-2S domain-containing protein [unclassified Synechococcus]MCT0232828.1 Rieske 2Fe-2S domain-containing protein [Synechococcus sp. CS-1327]